LNYFKTKGRNKFEVGLELGIGYLRLPKIQQGQKSLPLKQEKKGPWLKTLLFSRVSNWIVPKKEARKKVKVTKIGKEG